MAVVKGVKEKVHLPLYDSISVKTGKRLGETLTSNVLRFFQDVTGKTKLQTNMQAASLLPHWNTYEARALRIVISDLSSRFPETPKVNLSEVRLVDIDGKVSTATGFLTSPGTLNNLTLGNFVDLSQRLEAQRTRALLLSQGDIDALSTATNTVTLSASNGSKLPPGQFAELDRGRIEKLGDLLAEAGAVIPLNEQIFPNDGFGSVIGKFIYNTVTTFFVGEKIMIQVPTWFFPAGAGPYSENGKVTTHGYPSPQATFRFAEPVVIDAQQNFRVEIEVPESEVLAELQRLYGRLFSSLPLDGYMTRDVQYSFRIGDLSREGLLSRNRRLLVVPTWRGEFSMAALKGIKEKAHLPLYDSLFVRPRKQLREVESSSVFKFFVNAQGKTRLETNMQSSSLLPHWNTFEARALRVVISDLTPRYPAEIEECLKSSAENASGRGIVTPSPRPDAAPVSASGGGAKLKPRMLDQARERLAAFNAALAEGTEGEPDLEACLGLLRSFCDQQNMGQILQTHRNLRLLRADLTALIRRSRAKSQNLEALNQFADELEAMSEGADDLRFIKQLGEGGSCLDALERE